MPWAAILYGVKPSPTSSLLHQVAILWVSGNILFLYWWEMPGIKTGILCMQRRHITIIVLSQIAFLVAKYGSGSISSGMVKLNSLHSESEITYKRNKKKNKLFPWEFCCSRELYKMLSQNSLVALHKTSVTLTRALTSLIDHQRPPLSTRKPKIK